MFYKYRWLFFMIPIFVIFLIPANAEARSFTIDAVDINAFIYPNGDLYVEELYTYTFNGRYNGTTRIIGDDDFSGVEFFEGYEVPSDAVMGKITQDIAKPLKVEREDKTFKVHRSSANETNKVFYRYRLKGVVKKYEDVGQFYWRFFDQMGDEDLNHLRIYVHLYGVKQLENSYGFMHDVTGGEMNLKDSGLYYENEHLPGGEPFELRLLFPSSHLTEMDLTEQREILPTLLKEEENYQSRLAKRNEWLPILEKISGGFALLLLLPALYAIFYPKRFIRLFGRTAHIGEIEELDSLSLTALKRKLRFLPEDINAALFSLHQKGYVSIERIAAKKLHTEGAPDHSFQFILEKQPSDLPEHENFLIEWLFIKEDQGRKVFSLEQIPVLDKSKRKKAWSEQAEQARHSQQFVDQFKEWKKIAAKAPELRHLIKPVKLRKIFKFGIIPIWLIWSAINLLIGMGDRSDVYLMIGLLVFFYFAILIGKYERIISTLYFFIAFFAFLDPVLDPGLENLEFTPFLLFIIAAFLPTVSPTTKGIPYFKGMKKWRKQLKKGQLQLPRDPVLLETNFQHAIALEEGARFQAFYGEKIQTSPTNELYPFLIAPSETFAIYHYHRTYMRATYASSYSSSGGSSGSSGGSGGGGGAGAF